MPLVSCDCQENVYNHTCAGNSRWVHVMEWSGQKQFVASPEVLFEVDGSEAGLLKTYGPLGFLKVFILLLCARKHISVHDAHFYRCCFIK